MNIMDFYTLCLVLLIVIVSGISIALTAELIDKRFSDRED